MRNAGNSVAGENVNPEDNTVEVIEVHIVPEGIEKIRFIKFVSNVFSVLPSKKGIKKSIRRGEFYVDGKKAISGIWLQPGQCVELVRRNRTPRNVFQLDLEVVFEDNHLAIIDKPAGFDVSGNTFQTIRNALPANLVISRERDVLSEPRPVHRLDNHTRGLLIVAKTARAQMLLGHLFEKKLIRKQYRAIVAGTPPPSGLIDIPIGKQPATTRYTTVSSIPSLKYNSLSRMDLWPETGRTHQLRIHLAKIGHPILGDKRYGPKDLMQHEMMLCLCAITLEFPHPISGESLFFELPEPVNFELILNGS